MENFRRLEIDRAIASLETNQSLLYVGDEGCGKSAIAQDVHTAFSSRSWRVGIIDGTGTAKSILLELADQFGCDITDPSTGKALNADRLRDMLGVVLNEPQTLLICDDAHRYSIAMRLWLKKNLGDRALLLVLATKPPRSDLFLKMPRISIQNLESSEIRQIMLEEAAEIGVRLSADRIAELEQRCGGNPSLAQRTVQELSIGVGADEEGDRFDYIDGTPFLIAALSIIGIVRFIGMGLGDKSLYIIGGIATIGAITLRIVLMKTNMRNKTRIE